MRSLTTPQALALLDALRTEVVAHPDTTIAVDWHPGTLAIRVSEYGGDGRLARALLDATAHREIDT